MSDTESSEYIAAMRDREAVAQALLVLHQHAHRVLDVFLGAVDQEDARARLTDEFGFTDDQAMVVMDHQFRRLTGTQRQQAETMLSESRQALADLQTGRGH